MINDFESSAKIEAYLRNELSPAERTLFEQQVAQDPLLKNELELQREIISTLQEHRRSELKARLNRIDVNENEGNPPYTYLRIAGLMVATVAVLGVGTLLYHRNSMSGPSDEQKQTSTVPPVTIPEQQTPLFDSAVTSLQPDAAATAPAQASEDHRAPSKAMPPVTRTQPPQTTSAPASEPTGSKAIRPNKNREPFQQDETNVDSSVQEHHQNSAPNQEEEIGGSKITSSVGKGNSGLNITFDSSKSMFHYTYSHEKLELYGDFSRGYQKIRLGEQIYLYYEGNFYPIKQNQTRITPLEKVTDEKKLEKLQKLIDQE